MPPALDVGEGYSLQIATIDPTTGAAVAGTKITLVVLTAERGDAGTIIVPGDGEGWLLVPGPGA